METRVLVGTGLFVLAGIALITSHMWAAFLLVITGLLVFAD